MSNMLEYKGYLGSVEYSDADEILYGRLGFIRDLVTYEGADAKSLKAAFQEAVDDYLELCAAEGRQPDIPLKGSFNVRPGRDLHRRAMLYAKRRGINLNTLVSDALRQYLDREGQAA
ncbi:MULTISPECIES: type II toxin-antitoxin system HicB family antitoxin [unclassified Azospirillum]|uniref:type II toxin-antitoxin system HicB family antitoxin n=1 Tax=unclassified Azospirillum TaxID=2630922 RepID=UPI000B6D2A3F|nr:MULTISPECIES: type II toxin-antitoxin system HicB family antitoxin [unclassified Azospirillum]SNS31815.1 Predicted nuclease of the RNAse H fold, HicB family [Azospirillum sp. RU38E]SNS50213.1 Predicted nuclease of the RNAse H fold, HicB family [Azospirillum sp. RU37A]